MLKITREMVTKKQNKMKMMLMSPHRTGIVLSKLRNCGHNCDNLTRTDSPKWWLRCRCSRRAPAGSVPAQWWGGDTARPKGPARGTRPERLRRTDSRYHNRPCPIDRCERPRGGHFSCLKPQFGYNKAKCTNQLRPSIASRSVMQTTRDGVAHGYGVRLVKASEERWVKMISKSLLTPFYLPTAQRCHRLAEPPWKARSSVRKWVPW